MSTATAMTIPITGQDRRRRRSLPALPHWRKAFAVLLIVSLIAIAAVTRSHGFEVVAIALFGATAAVWAMTARAKREQARAAMAQEDTGAHSAIIDLGSAARASKSLDDFLTNVAMRVAATAHAASACILLHDTVTGKYVCRHRYPGLAVGLNSEPLWLDKDAFVVRRLRSLSMPMSVDPADFTSWVEALQGPARMRRQHECAVLHAMDSRLLVQVWSQDELVAVVSVGPGAEAFGTKMKRAMMALASQVSLAIENSYLVKRVADGERLRREIELAAEVQRKLLPEVAPRFARLEVAASCQPARDVAGDYFDYFAIDENRLGICIADVAGKGISAALLMSTVKALLRSHAGVESRGTQSTAAVIGACNRLLCEFTDAPRYATLFYAEFDSRDRALKYVNAGHNPPYVVRAGQAMPLEIGGPVMGLFADAAFEEGTVGLLEDDVLVAFTDGVLEAVNPAGVEFGAHNIISSVKTHVRSAEAMVAGALRTLHQWCDGTAIEDDATLLIARVT